MLIHKFFSVKREEIFFEMQSSTFKVRKCVTVSDKIILNYRDFQSSFKSHWNEVGDIHEGINYYGVTIILNEDIPAFYAMLEKYKIRRDIKRLRSLCRSAMEKGEDIVHFGI